MKVRHLKPLLLVLAMAGAVLPAFSQSPAERRAALPARKDPRMKGHDLAQERIEANLLWFGGEASPEYLDYKGSVARREMERWMPLAAGQVLPTIPSGSAIWTNLGPTANLTTAQFPDIDSGRPNSIVTHPTDPTLLYLATSTGGVFKCTNADVASASDWTWTPITDTLPNSSSSGNIPVGALAMSPADPNTLYAGLGDFVDDQGRGFYRSVNGGNTWTEATGIGAATRTTGILPLSASVVLWCTNDGLKRSTDGGQSFATVTMPGSPGLWAWSAIAFSPTEVAVVRANLRSGYRFYFQTGTIYWSNDAGATWTLATVNLTGGPSSFGRVALAAANGTTGWGLAEDAGNLGNVAKGLLKTTDKGHSWTWVAAPTVAGGLFQGIGNQMSTDGTQSGYNHVIAVHPTNPNQVTVGSNLALYRTDDGGLSWNQLTHWYGNRHVYAHADNHCAAWSQTGSPVLYIGNDGGLCVVRNPAIAAGSIPTGAGAVNSDVTFIDNRRNKGLASHQVYHLGSTIAASPANSRYRVTLGLQDNGTRVRQDTGSGMQNSSTFEDQIGGDGFGTVIHPVNGDLMLGSYYYAAIQKSTNGGITAFSPAVTGITESGNGNSAPFTTRIAPGEADGTGNTVYTFANTVVYKSTNFAGSWTAMGMTGFDNTKIIRQINAARTDANTLAVVTSSGTGFKTTNGGTLWTQFGAFPNNGSSMSYVWFDTSNALVMYAASVAPSATNSHLWKSTDGGNTWSAIDTGSNGFPFGIPVHVIKNDPSAPTTLLAGTDFGVYQSLNGGSTWARYGQGLPLVSVRDVYIAPDTTFVRAATYGRGVWEITGGTVIPGPTITTAPASTSVTLPAHAVFTVAATGTGTLTYQWKKGGADITGATASTYTTPLTTLADNGASFTVAVTDATGTTLSGAALLTVDDCATGGTSNVILNPGFETGASPWTVFSSAMIDSGTFPAHGGTSYAWLGDWGSATTDFIYQDVTIPANATAADLSFYMTIGNNSSTPAGVTNVTTLKVRTTGNADLQTLGTWNNTNANFPTYLLRGPYNLLAYKGTTVRVYFTSVQPGGSNTGTDFLVDDVALAVTVPGTSYALPVISTHPAGLTRSVGQGASFTVATSAGSPPLYYQWRKGGVPIIGAISATHTIASVQNADAGSYDCQVGNCAGIVASNPAILTVGSVSAPTVTSFLPTSGPVGTSVTLTGTGFTGATAVTFHGTSAITFAVVNDTSITATVPAGATSGTVSVTTAAGTGTSVASFTVTVAPTVTSFLPISGAVGTSVTLTGTGFTGATAVTFHGTSAITFAVVNDTSITATVPAGATSGTVSVTTAAGIGTSVASFTVTVAPTPTVVSFLPTSGPIGTSVTLTGTGFTGATAVKFNGTSAITFAVGSDTSITATVPFGATSGTVSVTTPGGTGASGASFTVTVVSVSILPASTSVLVGGQLSFTAVVTGTANTAVTWGLLGGGGTLTGGGVTSTANPVTFTAPATPGTTELVAHSVADASAIAFVFINTWQGDILDLAILARAYGSHPADSNWNAAADLNGDGVVNDLDLNLFFALAGF